MREHHVNRHHQLQGLDDPDVVSQLVTRKSLLAIKQESNPTTITVPQPRYSGVLNSANNIDDNQTLTSASMYPIEWRSGLLGITLRKNAMNQPCIRRISKKSGMAAMGIEKAAVGDLLVALNGHPTQRMEYEEIIEFLKTPTFPILLTFHRMMNATEDTEKTESGPTSHLGISHDFINNHRGKSMGSNARISTLCVNPIEKNDVRVNSQEISRAHGYAASVLPPPTENEYEVWWCEGVLGVAMKKDNDIPVVIRRNGKATQKDLHCIGSGDYLVNVNDKYTTDMGFEETMHQLKSLPKPLLLRFLKSDHNSDAASSSKISTSTSSEKSFHSTYSSGNQSNIIEETTDEEMDGFDYTITWTQGPLGVVLREYANGEVFVHQLNGQGESTRGASVKISVGDILISIANISVSALGFIQSINFLKSVAKPVELVFYRPQNQVSESLVKRYSAFSLEDSKASVLLSLGKDHHQSREVSLEYVESLDDHDLNDDDNNSSRRSSSNSSSSYNGRSHLAHHQDEVDLTPDIASQIHEPDMLRQRFIAPIHRSNNRDSSRCTDDDMSSFGFVDDRGIAQRQFPNRFSLSSTHSFSSTVFPACSTSSFTSSSDLDDRSSNTIDLTPDIHSSRGIAVSNGNRVISKSQDILLVWSVGPLGITFKRLGEKVLVSRLTSRGIMPGLSRLSEHYSLQWINDYCVSDVGFDSAMHLLKTLPKPIELIFTPNTAAASSPN